VRKSSLSKENQQPALEDAAKRVIFNSSQVRKKNLKKKSDFSPSLAHNPLQVMKSNAHSILTALIIKTTEELNPPSSMSTK